MPRQGRTAPTHGRDVARGSAAGTTLGNGRIYRWGSWLAVLLLATIALAAAQPRLPTWAPPLALVAESPERIELGPYLTVRHDPTGEWDAATAFNQQARGEFARNEPAITAHGFRTGAVWYHAVLYNRSHPARLWLLSNEYALLDRMDTYVRYPDGRVEHRESGDALNFHTRGAPYRHPNAWLELQRGQPVEILVRLQSAGSLQTPLVLWSSAGFTAHAAREQTGAGLYAGILLAMVFFNLVMWSTLRDASHAWYALHIASFAGALLVLQGLGFQFLWPASPRVAALSVPWATCLATACMLLFVRSILGLRTRGPLGNMLAWLLVGASVAIAAAAWWLPYQSATQAAMLASALGFLLAAVAAALSVRRGDSGAIAFLFALLPLLFGVALFTAATMGWMEPTPATTHALHVGSMLQMLLMTAVLGYRYAALRQENARVVREAREQLEAKVAQRTAELKAALAQLEHVHARTKDSSQRDPLTGLYNRRYFREAFERQLKEARETHTPMAVFMIDLDHFKMINDRYGHVVGDDCLRFTSRTIGPVLRPTGALLARYGGEEFVVVLNGHDLEAAHRVAEDVRRKMCEQPCRSGGHAVPMSCSIGLHPINPVLETSIESALEEADRALYRAKKDGRNCVRTSVRLADDHDAGAIEPVPVATSIDLATEREKRAQR